MLALCVLQNPAVVNVNQDLGGPKDLARPTAAMRAEQNLWEERKS